MKGIESTNKLKSQIQDVARNCDPSVAVKLTDFENILEIDIPDSNDKPHSCSSGFFRRIGANSQKMSRDEIVLQNTTQKTAQKTAQKELGETQQEILKLLSKNQYYTKNDLMKKLGKASGTINEHIKILQELGRLGRIGGRKDGHWEVIPKE